MRGRLGKIMIGTAVGAGALGVGLGGSLTVASAATSHSATTTSSAKTSTTAATSGTASVKAASASTATPSPSASPKATHNCQNMKNGQGRPGTPAGTSTGS